MKKLQEMLITARGELSRERIARATRRVEGGEPLTAYSIERLETKLLRPPPGIVLRTVAAAYGVNLLRMIEALDMWPALDAQQCSVEEFRSFLVSSRLELRALDASKGIAVVHGLRG